MNGTIPVLIFWPQLSNHVFAGMYRSPSSSGFVRRAVKTLTDGARAASISGVYGTSEGSERTSSAVGTSCAWIHFPSYCAHVNLFLYLEENCNIPEPFFYPFDPPKVNPQHQTRKWR